MKIRLSTVYDCPHLEFVEYLQRTESFRFITWPLLTFKPKKGVWPQRWLMGRDVFTFRFLGIVPMGKQQINISYPSQGVAAKDRVVLRDDGQGTLMKRWDHWVTVTPRGKSQTLYLDEVEVSARYLAPILTPLSGLFALVFYAHRQRRWKKFLTIQKKIL
jgi:hypothetical protein